MIVVGQPLWKEGRNIIIVVCWTSCDNIVICCLGRNLALELAVLVVVYWKERSSIIWVDLVKQ